MPPPKRNVTPAYELRTPPKYGLGLGRASTRQSMLPQIEASPLPSRVPLRLLPHRTRLPRLPLWTRQAAPYLLVAGPGPISLHHTRAAGLAWTGGYLVCPPPLDWLPAAASKSTAPQCPRNPLQEAAEARQQLLIRPASFARPSRQILFDYPCRLHRHRYPLGHCRLDHTGT